MDRKRLDLIIDRELRSALSVTPSSDFTARLHRRLADRPRPSLFPWRWFAFVGAPVAFIAVATGFVLLRPTPAGVRTVVTSAPLPAAVSRRTPLPVAVPAPPSTRPLTIRLTQATARREVETIVPPGQAEAIREFAKSLSEMSVSSRQLPRVVEVFEGELPQVPSYNEKRDER